LRHIPAYLRDTVFRLLPHRSPAGLQRIGKPGPESPVLLTGNFSLTVRRLRGALRGSDAWLLVADSRGINVWCAAGGGHFTHHDVISVLRSSGIDELVTRRDLILPQLAATGVERRPIEDATGWTTQWGPARLEDLPAVLERGGSVHGRERRMRFPLWERLDMAAMWLLPMILIGAPLFGVIGGWQVGLATAALMALTVPTIFAALPRLRVTGGLRWFTYAVFAAIGAGVGSGVLSLLDASSTPKLTVVAIAAVVAMVVLSVDLAGSTPMFPSTVNATVAGVPGIALDLDRCTGAADCVQVCPWEVLQLTSNPTRAKITDPDACIACGACIVQCPEDALYFAFPDGRVVAPTAVRSTHLNLLGQRTVGVQIGNEDRSPQV
jgi:NAD-dependent dihydropyrimidine dehydrogenase PreA subunit